MNIHIEYFITKFIEHDITYYLVEKDDVGTKVSNSNISLQMVSYTNGSIQCRDNFVFPT